MNDHENQIAENLRERLSNFPLYDKSHWISVYLGDYVSINYAPTWKRWENRGKTRFDINVKEDICYILSFNIEDEERRNGYGSLLSNLIVGFCLEEFDIRRFVTTPSGMSKKHKFWESNNFKYFNDNEVERIID